MDSGKKWIVRLGTLLVFNVAVVALIAFLVPQVNARFSGVFWGAVILTLATVWIKPALTSAATSAANRGAATRSRGAQRAVAALAVFLVAVVVWLLTVWLTRVSVQGWFWGYVLPPVGLLIAWFVYDRIDDALERQASKLYDAADRKLGS